MNIKAKLKLLAVMPVLLFVITGAVYFISSRTIGLNNEKALLADDIVKVTSDLTILSYEHNIAHEERPHMQWLQRSAALGALLKEAEASFTNDEKNPLLDDINRNYAAAGTVFGQIEAELKVAGGSATASQQEYLSRLHSRLLIELQSIIPRADKLHHLSHENVLRYARAQAFLNILFIVVLAVFVPVVSLFLIKGIAGPIGRLEQGMQVFASGGREAVSVTALDELGGLTQGFNEMSEKLWRQTHVDASMAEISRRILHEKGISIDDVSHIILECAQRLTASEFGLVGYFDPATGCLVAPTLSREVLAQCQVADKSIMLEKFGGLWGWVRENKQAALCNNLAEDPRVTGLPAGHVAIMRFLSVPALNGEALVGQVALANAPRDYTDEDLSLVGKVADLYAIALQRIRMEEEINQSYSTLESRVEERTAELFETNVQLKKEINERQQAEESLKRIEWMLTKSPSLSIGGKQSYGDLTELNHDGMIKNSVGIELLKEIVGDYLNLLGTSAAIYEKNGDYACGIFSSNWCQVMDLASRKLCCTDDNVTALNSGKWLCHESCWTSVSKESNATRQPVDLACNGGIRLYAEPIFAGNEVIGSINFGYSDPPKDPAKLRELADLYRVDYDELVQHATSYDSRPSYIIDMAKSRLQASARLIGALVERTHAESKLKITAGELERSNRELQQFAYIASHDLQEPLRKITAFGDRLVMQSAAGLDDKSRDYLARMQSAAGRMKHLIEDLLNYSRVTTQAKPFTAVDLGELLGETLETLEYRMAETDGQIEISGDLPSVDGDRSQLQQLFQNLLGNALKYHQYDLPPRIIVASQSRADGLAEIVVTDNGIGFDEKYLDRIFLPFQRLHARQEYEGTGIGLAICQKIVQRHGGTLTARSEPGVGSSFVVTLPISRNEVSHAHPEKTGGDPDCRG